MGLLFRSCIVLCVSWVVVFSCLFVYVVRVVVRRCFFWILLVEVSCVVCLNVCVVVC